MDWITIGLLIIHSEELKQQFMKVWVCTNLYFLSKFSFVKNGITNGVEKSGTKLYQRNDLIYSTVTINFCKLYFI